MEKKLFSNKFMCIKYIKHTVLFGISYDRPQLFVAFLCFIMELNFAKAKKRPENYL